MLFNKLRLGSEGWSFLLLCFFGFWGWFFVGFLVVVGFGFFFHFCRTREMHNSLVLRLFVTSRLSRKNLVNGLFKIC